MLRLRPYKPCDGKAVASWPDNEYAFRQWSADRYESYPITGEDINAYYDRDRDNENLWAMTAFDEEGVAGHLIMRFPQPDKDTIRFGFVIVDSKKRRKGYGREMLSLAVRYAFECLKVRRITLGVFENNEPAIRCYRSCGFQPVALEHPEHYFCMGEDWNCIEMELKRKDD